jgi:hypothetical protein
MTIKKYIQVCDPGHGWLKVPRADYDASGFKASSFSYQSDNSKYIYLEEDCDLYGFLKAAGLLMPFNGSWAIDRSKVEIAYKHVNKTSIRDMRPISLMTRAEYESRFKTLNL